jgi:hypothetical protein
MPLRLRRLFLVAACDGLGHSVLQRRNSDRGSSRSGFYRLGFRTRTDSTSPGWNSPGEA